MTRAFLYGHLKKPLFVIVNFIDLAKILQNKRAKASWFKTNQT